MNYWARIRVNSFLRSRTLGIRVEVYTTVPIDKLNYAPAHPYDGPDSPKFINDLTKITRNARLLFADRTNAAAVDVDENMEAMKAT